MGNPFVHVELNTSDPDAAKKFYGALFDWKLSDMPMGEGAMYTMVDVGQGTGGGLQKQMMPGAPSAWLSYVLVDDLKKSIARARDLGARIFEEYIPVPGMGALGIFADPTGAVLGLWEPAPRQPEPKAKAAAKPAAKKPAAKPAAKKPAKAAAKKPAAKKPAAKKPAAKKPAKKPVGKKKR